MRLAGYAAIFDAPDKGGDIVRKGGVDRLSSKIRSELIVFLAAFWVRTYSSE